MSPRISNYVQDIRLPSGFMRDLRFMRMFGMFGAEGALAILLLWDWVSEQFPTTGILEKASAGVLHVVCGIASDREEFISAMIDAGALAQDENGTFYLPGWVEDQPYAAEAEMRSAKARENAHKRWGNDPATGHKKTLCHGIAPALHSECSNTNSKAFKSPPAPPRGGQTQFVPVSEIVDLYRKALPELPEPREETEKLGKDITARWMSKSERQSLEWWAGFFALVRECPYLLGESTGDWRASLGWLVNKGNMDKVLGGEYPTREQAEATRSAKGEVVRETKSWSLEEYEQMRTERARELAEDSPG